MPNEFSTEELAEVYELFRQDQRPRRELILPATTQNSGHNYEPPPPPLDNDIEENSTDKAIHDIGIQFEDSAELINFFNQDILDGNVTLHPWQVEINEFLCKSHPTSQHPLKFCLCAANGSGKDAFVIAPFAVWFALTKKRSYVVITSSSGVQLTNQTERYIGDLARRINIWFKEHFGQEVFKVVQRRIECTLTGSIIHLFATDEEGRAEGYHPIDAIGEFVIIVNEAKTVSPEIFRALRRCTGFNYWINVSTPGAPAGDFYKAFTSWAHKRRVTFFDCPHLSREEFESEKRELGEHNPLFRSKWLALFTTIDGNFVIPQQAIERLQRMISSNAIHHVHKHWALRVGVDLAAGGDEDVVSVWQGNKQIGLKYFRIADTTVAAERIEKVFLDFKLEKDHEHIFADDGGVGRAIIDMLRQKGWNIKRVNNQWAAHNKKDYKNRGAENWARFSRFVEQGLIIPIDDHKQWEQLATRRYNQKDGGRIGLESKAEARADGLASPDRADATVLAFSDVSFSALEDIHDEIEKDKPKRTFTRSADVLEDRLFNIEFSRRILRMSGGKINGSLSVALEQDKGFNRKIKKYVR